MEMTTLRRRSSASSNNDIGTSNSDNHTSLRSKSNNHHHRHHRHNKNPLPTTHSISKNGPNKSNKSVTNTVDSSSNYLVCPICCEDMTLLFTNSKYFCLNLTCCNKIICQSCLYRHIYSILEEGISGGNGRKIISCPFGCGTTINDKIIRDCFHRQHYNLHWEVFGKYICFYLLVIIPRIILSYYYYHGKINYYCFEQDPFQSSTYYEKWLYYCHTSKELRDLNRYEQFNLIVAAASILQDEQCKQSSSSSNSNNDATIISPIIRCPAPDCTNFWLIANIDHRKYKLQHEEKNQRRSLLLSFFYSPPCVEPELPYNWVQPEYININEMNDVPIHDAADEKDGRYICCSKCHVSFCSLCLRPWKLSSGNKVTHRNLSCISYKNKLHALGNLDNDPDYAFGAQNSRMCPGCSLRTSRIDGCNHMTCPCGFEWCYICECRWNVTHYSCVDDGANNTSHTGCSIS